MADRDENRFVDSLVARDLSIGTTDFSPEDLAFVRAHPEVLRKLADPLEIKKRYIYVLFLVAAIMAAVSKVLEYTKALAHEATLNDLMTNVLFSVSVELFGAATVAYLMELVFERRVKRNQDLIDAFMAEAAADHPSGESPPKE